MNQHDESVPTRRRMLGAIGAGALLGSSGLGLAAGTAHAAGAGQIVELGVPMRTVNVRFAKGGVMPDGTPVIFAMSDGNPVSFNVVRVHTGEVVDAFELPPDTVGASLVQHPDHSVYFSVRAPSAGVLSRYRPDTGTVETVAERVVGESLLRTLVVDDAGAVYGTTYPNAKAFAYDPVTGSIRDYGRLVEGENDRGWGFDLVDGSLWVGTGIGAPAHLVELDPVTGETVEIPLPDAYADGTTLIYGIHDRGDVAFVLVSPSVDGQSVLVYDKANRQWAYEDSVPNGTIAASGVMSELDANGVCYFRMGNEIYAYDTTTHTTTPTGFAGSNIADRAADTRSIDVIESGAGATVLAGIQQTGDVWTFDVGTGAGDVVPNQILGAPATVHSLGIGPDDKVYVGAYLSSGVMARISTSTYEIEQLVGPGQSDTTYAYRGGLVVTSYPEAVVHYGRTDPWDWGTNPAELFRLGRDETGQDRIFDVTSIGGRLAIGTVPNYGELGGALAFADADGTVAEVHRHVVTDQSVTALAVQGKWLYGGTSIHGGLSTTPTATESALFIWDASIGKKVFETVPVPEAEVIHTLTVHAGRLWGMTDTGVVFEFDIQRRQVLRSVDVGLPDTNSWGRLGSLYFRDEDARFYGNAGGKLFRMNPETMEVTVLATEAKVSVLAPTGEIFFGDNRSVYVYRPQ